MPTCENSSVDFQMTVNEDWQTAPDYPNSDVAVNLEHTAYTLSVAVETSHVCPATPKEEKTQRLGRYAYPLSWACMAIFDLLGVVDSSLWSHSTYQAPTLLLRLTLVLILFPVYACPDRGGYFEISEAPATNDVEHNAEEEEQLPKLATMDQSIEDEIQAAGGYWRWMKKFYIFAPWVWPDNIPWKWKKLSAVSAILLRLTEALGSLGVPFLFNMFIDHATRDSRNTCTLIGWYTLYAITKWLVTRGIACWRKLCWKNLELERDSHVKQTAFSHVMNQDADVQRASNSIDTNTAVSMGTDVCKCFDFMFYEAPPQLLLSIATGGLILWQFGSQIFLLQTFSIALETILTLRVKRGSVPIFDRHIAAYHKTTFLQQSALNGRTAIAALGQTDHVVGRHSDAVSAENKTVFGSWKYATNWNFVLGGLHTVTQIANVSFLIINHESNFDLVKDILLYVSFALYLEGSIDFFSQGFQDIFNSFISAARLRRLIEIVPGMQDGTRGMAGSGIRFRNVSFGYEPDKLVFKKINLHFELGKTTAIVGATGTGKSTAGMLIQRQDDPTEGTIERNGQDLRQILKKELRRDTSLMEQSPYLLIDKNFYDNIRLDCQEISEEEIQDACKKAGIHEEIMRRQGQYNSLPGETLSGGQKQKVAFARSIVHRGSLVILDEPTSAQDVESEDIIKKAIKELGNTKTVIIIAHRLSAIRSADRIIVLEASEEGHTKVAEEGTHDELLKRGGLYSRMWKTFIGEE